MSPVTRAAERLLRALAALCEGMEGHMPEAPRQARWMRESARLREESQALAVLGAQRTSERHEPREQLAGRLQGLTTLARSQDGLPLDHHGAEFGDQLRAHRREVVLAAWQLGQALRSEQ